MKTFTLVVLLVLQVAVVFGQVGAPPTNPLATKLPTPAAVPAPASPIALQAAAPVAPITIAKAPATPAAAPVVAAKPVLPPINQAEIARQAVQAMIAQKKEQDVRPDLTPQFIVELGKKVDDIRDTLDAANLPSPEEGPQAQKFLLTHKAKKAIAAQLSHTLKASLKAFQKATDGVLTPKDIAKVTKLNDLHAQKKEVKKFLKLADKVVAKNTKPTGPSYADHAENPKHDLKALESAQAAIAANSARFMQVESQVEGMPLKLNKKAADSTLVHSIKNLVKLRKSIPARFQQLESESELPPGVNGDGHEQMLMATVKSILDLQNPSANYKGQVNAEGKLCPGCDEIKYNADSPLSEHDLKALRAQHAAVVTDDVKLHSQLTLDKATLQVDDADKLKAKLLAQYPTADSLIQFDNIHN